MAGARQRSGHIGSGAAAGTFSSMFHGRGLPDKKAVEEYLLAGMFWQQPEGHTTRTLDRKLLRAFASMFNGKGLAR